MKTDLLEAYLSGELDIETHASVDSALRNDKALREVYFQQQRIDAALEVLFNGEADVSSDEFSRGIMARLAMEGADTSSSDSRNFSKSVLTEILEEKEKVVPLRWPDFVKSAAVAAVAVFAVMAVFQMVDLSNEGAGVSADAIESGQSGYMARIQSSKNAVWEVASRKAIQADGWIGNGMIVLESGVAELAFNSGARTFVEGPATLSIESENRAFLESGRLTAEVTGKSSGFTINTPRMNIVDIGTRFGVSVDENGDTEVHVMEGVVEASRSSGNAVSVLLREGNALKADSRMLSALEPVTYSGMDFALTAGVNSEPEAVIEYNFDESGGSDLIDSGNRRKGGPYDLSLRDGQVFDAGPRRAPGYRGGGLVFRRNQVLTSVVSREFLVTDPFTICFWMKVPPKVGRQIDDFVLSWGPEGAAWEFGCRNATGGGELIAKYGNGYVVGSTDLADGKWHHVAVRFIGGDAAHLQSHVHLYVDGMLENVRSWRNSEITGGQTGEMRIGDLQDSGFPGWIDQVSVFDESISTGAIQKMVTE